MATKVQIRKWVKEVMEPTFKKYNFKYKKEKKCSGGVFYIMRETKQEKLIMNTDLLDRHYLQINSVKCTNLVLHNIVVR